MVRGVFTRIEVGATSKTETGFQEKSAEAERRKFFQDLCELLWRDEAKRDHALAETARISTRMGRYLLEQKPKYGPSPRVADAVIDEVRRRIR